MNWLSKTIKYLLLTTVLTPLITTPSVIFPYTFGKITLFRGSVLLSLALTCFWLALEIWQGRENFKNLGLRILGFLKSKFGIIFSLTAVSFLISGILAIDPFIAFWGDVERGEGIIGIFIIGIFLLLAKFWFDSEDWKKFWWATWGVGVVLSIYGWLEYLGLFGVAKSDRVASLFGNAGVLSTHLILLAPVIFFLYSKYSKGIKIVLVASAALFLSVLFLTGTRGALMGLVGGLVFLLIKAAWHGERKKIAGLVLAGLVFFGVIFGITREAEVWQKVPILDRLAKVSLFDTNDPSTATRLITWKLSWEAFKEKPIFGWGPEHFITAYERHYDPEFATYGETWIDRAHNQVLDLLVSRGILGLLLWLGLLIILFSLPIDKSWRGYWQAFVVAYLVQGIFIFDSFLAYIMLAAFLASWLPKTDQIQKEVGARENNIVWFPFLVGLFVLIFSYFAVWLPFEQAKQYRSASKNQAVEEVVREIRAASYPYTFAQPNLRIKTVDTFYLDEFFYRDEYRQNPKFKALGDVLVENMKEVVKRHGAYDIRYSIQLAEVLNAYARDNKDIYKETEKIIRSALEFSPNRLELYYHLAFALAGQGRSAEAVEVVRKALILNERAPRSHFSLALMLAADHKDAESQFQLEELKKIDPNLSNLLASDKRTLGMLYSAWGRYEDVGNLVLLSLRNVRGFGVGILDRNTYEDALRYFAAQEKSEEFLLVAEYLKKFPDLKEDMEVLSDLVRNKNWAIIHKLK